jgi:GNAT superfamily N-acetyltransferase
MGAFVRGRLIGAGYCQGAFTAGDRPFEHALYLSDFVLPAWRRRGIAQQLHAARLRELQTLGCTKAFGWVDPANHAAAAALLAVGFECLAESEVPAWLPRPSIKHLLVAKSMAR